MEHPHNRNTMTVYRAQCLLAQRSTRMVVNKVGSPIDETPIDEPRDAALVPQPTDKPQLPTFGIHRLEVRQVDSIHLYRPVVLRPHRISIPVGLFGAQHTHNMPTFSHHATDVANIDRCSTSVVGWIRLGDVPDG